MACFRWMGMLALLLLTACGGGDGAAGGMDSDGAGDGDTGDGDGDGDGDDTSDQVFNFGRDAGQTPPASTSNDAGITDAMGSSDTSRPSPSVGDGWLRFDDIEPAEDGAVWLDIDVPSGTDAMVVTLDPGTTPRSLALVELTDPTGDLLYDFRDEDTVRPYRPALLRNVNDYLPYSFMVPTDPGAPLRSGTYEVLLYVEDPSAPVDVDVVFQSIPDGDVEPRLAVVLWFAQGTSMDATAARADADFGDAVDTMVGIFRDHGIRIDSIEYGDIPGDDSLATVEGDQELAELVGNLRGDSEQTLHFIFVEHMETDGGATVRGKSTGMPGPPSHPSFARRGAVVIPLDVLPTSIRRTGEVLAHEAGHYLGLAHTTEADGIRHDPIEDTPECPGDLASEMTPSGEKILVPADCAEYDGDNLMFYTQPPGSADQRALTDGQAIMMAVNPMVRWVVP